jgi:hypothetical protein
MKRIKKFIWGVCGVITAFLGLVVIFYGLTILGWRRHGTSPLDFSFLHLDWIFQPELPYWCAHLFNLMIVLIGFILGGAGLVICARTLRLGLKPKKPNRVPGSD